MPQLRNISASFFVNLLSRLGVKPPFELPFQLINTVQPVSIVDSDIILSTQVTEPIFPTPFSAGHTVAPAINTVLADTGPLAAGNWAFKFILEVIDGAAAGTQTAIQHRNAANGANIWEINSYTVAGGPMIAREIELVKTVALNERLRIINLIAGAAGSFYQGTIFALQIS